ncbi:MAG TPA: CheR family methyltransferase [Polyangiales bacterium]
MTRRKIEALLLSQIGLQAETLGKDAVMDAVRVRMTARSMTDAAHYAHVLAAEPSELQALIEEVVVSETWFFREPASYQMLRERLAANPPSGPIQVLSVPCATGEEPYSIVMTLLEAGYDLTQIEVHGVDVSQNALRLAAVGRYRRNSFRGNMDAYHGYFEQHDGVFQLSAKVRSAVQLRAGNVLDGKLFSGKKFHAVFCRNLLIYLDRRSRAMALENLQRMLRPEGVLFVGHSEAGDVASHGLVRVGDPRSFAFTPGTPRSERVSKANDRPSAANERKRSVPTTPRRSLRAKPSAAEPAQPGEKRSKPQSLSPRRSLAARSGRPPRGSQSAGDLLQQARQLADRGALHEALACCERASATNANEPELHSLLGVVKRALGDLRGARASFMRALELDAHHQEALVHLGLLCESEGDATGASRYRARVRGRGSEP